MCAAFWQNLAAGTQLKPEELTTGEAVKTLVSGVAVAEAAAALVYYALPVIGGTAIIGSGALAASCAPEGREDNAGEGADEIEDGTNVPPSGGQGDTPALPDPVWTTFGDTGGLLAESKKVVFGPVDIASDGLEDFKSLWVEFSTDTSIIGYNDSEGETGLDLSLQACGPEENRWDCPQMPTKYENNFYGLISVNLADAVKHCSWTPDGETVQPYEQFFDCPNLPEWRVPTFLNSVTVKLYDKADNLVGEYDLPALNCSEEPEDIDQVLEDPDNPDIAQWRLGIVGGDGSQYAPAPVRVNFTSELLADIKDKTLGIYSFTVEGTAVAYTRNAMETAFYMSPLKMLFQGNR
jgi:hypothetical protein